MTLLPLPEAPRIVVVSPRRSSRFRSVKMIFGPKRFFTWEKRMITSPIGVRASGLTRRRPARRAHRWDGRTGEASLSQAVASLHRVEGLHPHLDRAAAAVVVAPEPPDDAHEASPSAGDARGEVVPERTEACPLPVLELDREVPLFHDARAERRARACISRSGAGFAWPHGSKRSRSRKTRAGSSPPASGASGRNEAGAGAPIPHARRTPRRSGRGARRRRPAATWTPAAASCPPKPRSASLQRESAE